MRQSPSIIPTDRLDRDIYLVLEDFSSGAAWRETDEGQTDVSAVIEDLLTGQYEQAHLPQIGRYSSITRCASSKRDGVGSGAALPRVGFMNPWLDENQKGPSI